MPGLKQSAFRFITMVLLTLCVLSGLSACKPAHQKTENPDQDELKILRRGLPVEPLSIDPHKGLGSWVQDIVGDMMIGLYVENASGEVVPALAETFKVSPNGRKWRFTLKSAKWSDGKPVTANDFVYAFQRLINPKTVSHYAPLHFGIKNAEKINKGELPPEMLGVRALDKKTLEFELEYPMPYFKRLLAHYASLPLPKQSVSRYGDDWTRPENMVVNGPYRLKQWRLNDFIHLVKNPKYYHKDRVCFDEVIYQRTTDPEVAIRLVKKGVLDIGWEGPGEKLDIIETEMPDYLHTYPLLETDYIVFNTTNRLFLRPDVREALSMVIDRDYIVRHILKEAQTVNAFVPPEIGNYVAEKDRPEVWWGRLDLQKRRQKALEILRKAGYGEDNPIKFEYLYRSNNNASRIASLLQNDWNSLAGWIHVSLLGVDTQLQIKRLRLGDFDLASAGWIADYNDPYNFLFLLESATGAINYGRYHNQAYDDLLKKANTERDREKRAEILAQAEQFILDDAALIPLWNKLALHMVNPEITGFFANAADNHRSEYLCRKSLKKHSKAQ